MPIRIYLASSNPGKMRELAALAEEQEIELALLPDYERLPPAREDGARFPLTAPEKRSARYVCVLALAQRNRILALISDSCEGRLLEAPRGTGGFGYDPYFFYPPLNCTLAEVSTGEKKQHSHRAQA